MAKKRSIIDGPDLFSATEPKKLFLLDGMALIYRAHFGMIRSPRFTSGEIPTSAVFGIANTVFDLIKKQKPTHIAIAFDTSDPTFRHEVFDDYKAQRDKLPEDIATQIPMVDQLMQALNISIIRTPGFEADDIIGTLAIEAAAEDFNVFMVTPDKDYHQLVTDKITVYKPGHRGGTFEQLDVAAVLEKWQIERVDQVIDILGLMGDKSDNIPGIPGVGEKTAVKLISQFGTIEKLLDSTSELKGKQKERVEENRDMALLSKMLVTIKTDVPHDFRLADFQLREANDEALRQLFMEWEFDSLGRKMFGKSFTSAPKRAAVIREKREKEIQSTLFDEGVAKEKSLATVKHNYQLVETPQQRADLIQLLKKQTAFCFDTETTGLDPRKALPLGVAFAFEPHSAYYVTCPEGISEAQSVLEEFREVLEDKSIEKIGHNLKYDLTLLRWHGIEVHGKLMDTMLAHSMKEPEMSHGLDYLAKLYLGYRPIPISDLIGPKGEEQKSLRDVPLDKVCEYACEDADITLQVAAVLRPDIESRGVSEVCYDIECPLIPVLVDMEYEGITLDTDALADFSKRLEVEIVELRDGIYEEAGREFNIDSPKQLGTILYDELELVSNPKKTATGQYSTRESELLRLAPNHKIVADVLEYRNAVKLKSVYVDQLPNTIDDQSRLHTHYSQTWTATGRMQSNNPNLQTIPIRKQRGKEIRAAFVPRGEDFEILSADYSQIELRIMADLSEDPTMLEAFNSGADIHQSTASKVYKVDPEAVTREMRDKAKTVNFGIIYGISAFGLQQRLNIPRNEANELIENYFDKHPGVQSYIDRTIEFGREHGYVATRTGRRRYLRDINSRNKTLQRAAERLAMNSPIQGTAADMLKLAMIRVYEALESGGFATKMLLTVHDEIVFDMHKDETETVIPVIVEAMKNAIPMKVPIEVETGHGANWLIAH
jgi:DNA polymerase-1